MKTAKLDWFSSLPGVSDNHTNLVSDGTPGNELTTVTGDTTITGNIFRLSKRL